MKLYFDTEFTGLHKNTTLMSIGLISDDNKMFYAEFTDYDENQVDDWLIENVISNFELERDIGKNNAVTVSDTLTLVCANKYVISEELNKWLSQFDTIEWVSDCCHYDFVLLIDLVYGHALKMPYGKHCAACHDINQDIANLLIIDEIKAFDLSRERLLDKFNISIDGSKHNALYDAKVIKSLYKAIKANKDLENNNIEV